MVRAFQMNLTVLSLVGLLVGMFLIYNTISFSVAQRRREIGIFRAVGMSEHMIGALFVVEAAMMGILGGLLGALAGVVVARVLIGLLSRTVSELFSPVAHAFMIVGGEQWLGVLLEGALLGGGVSAFGAIGPSVDAAKTVVVMALAPGGYDVTQETRIRPAAFVGCLFLLISAILFSASPVNGTPVFGYTAAFCLLAGLTCLVPLCIQTVHRWGQTTRNVDHVSTGHAIRQIAAEQIARAATRSAVTVSALLVGVAIMVGVVMMVRSFRHTVELWIDQTVMADLIVAPHAWLQGTQGGSADKSLPASLRDRIQSVEGVEAVDTYRDMRMLVTGKSVALVSRDLRMHAERSRYLFLSGDSHAILHQAVDRGAVVVSEVLAQRLGVVQGGMLELPTSTGIRSFPVQGVFYDYATDGGKIVMDRTTYQKWWHDDMSATVFPVYLKENQDLGQVRQRIVRRMADDDENGVMPSVISNRELRTEILDIFDRTFVLTYALETIAVLIAILGIVNTLVTSVLERRREFAVLQALGASERQIKLLVLWESIYLAAIGTFLGAVGGLLLSSILIKVVNKQSFGWTIQMEWAPEIWIEAVVIAAGVALLAGWWPARWASKQSVVDGLRYE
jgi:putative ABC transport system permease protein